MNIFEQNNSTQGKRNTKQRTMILDTIREMKTHPTAEELYLKLKYLLPNISLSTVYRNLDILKLMGLIKKIESAAGQSRYDGKTYEHHHAKCIQCGRIEDITGLILSNDLIEAKKHTTFRLIESKTEFLGLCPICEEENRKKNSSIKDYCEKNTNNL